MRLLISAGGTIKAFDYPDDYVVKFEGGNVVVLAPKAKVPCAYFAKDNFVGVVEMGDLIGIHIL